LRVVNHHSAGMSERPTPPLPYPEYLETVGAARDGTRIALLLMRLEDEPLLQPLFVHMTGEDQRLRFSPRCAN
jgi:hypothetical protein